MKKFRKLLALNLALLMLFSMLPMAALAEGEGNSGESSTIPASGSNADGNYVLTEGIPISFDFEALAEPTSPNFTHMFRFYMFTPDETGFYEIRTVSTKDAGENEPFATWASLLLYGTNEESQETVNLNYTRNSSFDITSDGSYVVRNTAYLTENQKYAVFVYPEYYPNKTHHTLSARKITGAVLNAGVETSVTTTEEDTYAAFTFTPSKSGWYDMTDNVPENGYAWRTVWGDEMQSSSFPTYLEKDTTYYVSFLPFIAGNNVTGNYTIKVDDAAFPEVITSDEVRNVNNWFKFTAPETGKYTIWISIKSSEQPGVYDGIFWVNLYNATGEYVQQIKFYDDNNVGRYIAGIDTKMFQKGETMYLRGYVFGEHSNDYYMIAVANPRLEQTMTFANAAVTKTFGDDAFTNALTRAPDSTAVTY